MTLWKCTSYGPYSGFGTQASYFDNREEFPSRFAWDKPASVELSWSGADRTGAVAMILEALLGVRGGDIARDYEQTSLSSEGSGQTRSAISALRSGYGFFGRGFTTLEVDEQNAERRLQKQAYTYLNTAFPEFSISADDLDWFIDYMLE